MWVAIWCSFLVYCLCSSYDLSLILVTVYKHHYKQIGKIIMTTNAKMKQITSNTAHYDMLEQITEKKLKVCFPENPQTHTEQQNINMVNPTGTAMCGGIKKPYRAQKFMHKYFFFFYILKSAVEKRQERRHNQQSMARWLEIKTILT